MMICLTLLSYPFFLIGHKIKDRIMRPLLYLAAHDPTVGTSFWLSGEMLIMIFKNPNE